MKTHREMHVSIHFLCSSAVLGVEWSASRSGRFILEKEPLRTKWIGNRISGIKPNDTAWQTIFFSAVLIGWWKVSSIYTAFVSTREQSKTNGDLWGLQWDGRRPLQFPRFSAYAVRRDACVVYIMTVTPLFGPCAQLNRPWFASKIIMSITLLHCHPTLAAATTPTLNHPHITPSLSGPFLFLQQNTSVRGLVRTPPLPRGSSSPM
jgi:hypothetical protein